MLRKGSCRGDDGDDAGVSSLLSKEKYDKMMFTVLPVSLGFGEGGICSRGLLPSPSPTCSSAAALDRSSWYSAMDEATNLPHMST